MKNLLVLLLFLIGFIGTSNANNLQISKNFEMINLSSIEDQYFIDRAIYAESKMASLTAKTLVLIYPLGDFLSFDALDEMDFLGSVHVTHKIVLDDKQIEKTLVTMKNFLSNKICIDSRKKKYLLKNVGWVLKNGFASGLQIPFCKNVRFVMMSVSPKLRKNKKELQRIFFHEVYHSFQQDLTNNCRSPNDLWVIESGAEYFAKHSTAFFENSSKGYINEILEWASENASRHGLKLEDPGVAEKGLGALRLMIEKGWLEESRILDGSLFHNCARVREFKNSDPKIQYLKDNWFKILKQNGNYRFNLSMLKETDIEKPVIVESVITEIVEPKPEGRIELCREHITANWNGYMDINKKKFNTKGYFFAVVGEDGRCEHGIGPTQKDAFNDCNHWKEKNNIIGTCELYARGQEVVRRKN